MNLVENVYSCIQNVLNGGNSMFKVSAINIFINLINKWFLLCWPIYNKHFQINTEKVLNELKLRPRRVDVVIILCL